MGLPSSLRFMVRLERDEPVEILKLHTGTCKTDAAVGEPRSEQDALQFSFEGEEAFEKTVLLLVQVNGALVVRVVSDHRNV